mgnify:CR=1 FL=1
MFNVLHPRETAKTVTIFDVDGLSIGSVAGEPLEFIRRASHVMQVGSGRSKSKRIRVFQVEGEVTEKREDESDDYWSL